MLAILAAPGLWTQRIIGSLAADHKVEFGQLRAEYGLAAIAYVRRAVELCMKGEADAMVTGPLNKEAVTLSGQAFCGPY